MKTQLSLLALMSLTIPALASAADAGRPAATKIDSGRYIVASDVPAEQSQILQKDLAFMYALNFRDDAALSQMMELDGNLNAASLDSWLSDRVQYIISENTDLDSAVAPVTQGYAFENPGVLPPLESIEGAPDISVQNASNTPTAGHGKAVMVMANVGAMIYGMGKEQNTLLGVNVPGAGTVLMSSPRTGVIQIGEGMFAPIFQRKGMSDTSTPLYSLSRLATLFHEARHSDGNGESTGFLHTICPLGHDYEGIAACDLSLNGAYTVGAMFERTITAACDKCSAAEKELAKLETLDSFNRVLKTGYKFDDAADYTYKCNKAAQMAANIGDEAMAFCKWLGQQKLETVTASNWDAAPEGQRLKK
jgi:hypothetical protein